MNQFVFKLRPRKIKIVTMILIISFSIPDSPNRLDFKSTFTVRGEVFVYLCASHTFSADGLFRKSGNIVFCRFKNEY